MVSSTGCLKLCEKGPVVSFTPRLLVQRGGREEAIDEILDALEDGGPAKDTCCDDVKRRHASEAKHLIGLCGLPRRFAPRNAGIFGLVQKDMDEVHLHGKQPCPLKNGKDQIHRKGEEPFEMDCNRDSLAGAVSQRACVFCGSRVVLYPIADALHLVHGPIGCAAYTWDIRGALSSGPELHRLSFSTDLREKDVIFGGEKKL